MQQNEHVIQILSDLVAIDSQSHKGNEEIISYLSKLFAGYSQLQQSWVRDIDNVQGKNLIVKIPGKNNKHSIVFVCHMDTVPTSSAWETDPFILEEKEGNLYGLGACDTKGGVAALIEAVITLSDKPAYDTYLVFDGDEEVRFTGAKFYHKHLSLSNAHFVAIEPTDKNICIGARSSFSAELITYGKAQHASFGSPEVNESQSAVYKMYKIMGALMEDAKELAKESDPIMGSNSQNLGVIRGGTADNVIPDMCTLSLDRRLLPQRDLTKEVERISDLIHAIDKDATFTDKLCEKGFQTSTSAPLVQQSLQIMQDFMPKAHPVSFQAMSEISLFQDKGDAIILGPGSIREAHVANEFVNAQDIFHFVHIYQRILQEVRF